MEKNIVIIVPAYNEETTIGSVVSGIRNNIRAADIIVVNDGSTDRTESAARKSGASVINLPFNFGYGAALQTGFKYTVRHGYKYAVQIDGDGQHNPFFLPNLIREIEKGDADVVIGSRYIGGKR